MKALQDCRSLEEIRSEIDWLDQAISATIGQRGAYVHAATRFKRSEMDAHVPQRQRQMLAARRLWATEEGVDPDLIEALFRLLVDHFMAAELAVLSEREGSMASRLSSSKTTKAAAIEFGDATDF